MLRRSVASKIRFTNWIERHRVTHILVEEAAAAEEPAVAVAAPRATRDATARRPGKTAVRYG